MHYPECSVIICAAGGSTRMGQPKPFLPWTDGRTFLEKIIDEYRRIQCVEIVVVVNSSFADVYKKHGHDFLDREKIIVNQHLERGRFYSIKLGALALGYASSAPDRASPAPDSTSPAPFCFIQSVDMPFVTERTLFALLFAGREDAYVAPRFGDRGGHPVLLGARVAAKLAYERDDSNLKDALRGCEKISVVVNDEGVIININTMVEYRQHFGKGGEP